MSPNSMRIDETIAQNIAEVRQVIDEACARVGRTSDSLTLVAVSKQRTVQEISVALQCGLRHFGENRIEEAITKRSSMPTWLPENCEPPIWHMIGHVQSRKAQDVVQNFDIIHSLDSVKLARRFSTFNENLTAQPKILLEINISGETAKAGFDAHQWENDTSQRTALWEMVSQMQALPNLTIAGLMTMAPYTENNAIIRNVFARLRHLRDALAEDFPQFDWQELSMGMTNDYPIAIEEGATIIRVGRAIFGENS